MWREMDDSSGEWVREGVHEWAGLLAASRRPHHGIGVIEWLLRRAVLKVAWGVRNYEWARTGLHK